MQIPYRHTEVLPVGARGNRRRDKYVRNMLDSAIIRNHGKRKMDFWTVVRSVVAGLGAGTLILFCILPPLFAVGLAIARMVMRRREKDR